MSLDKELQHILRLVHDYAEKKNKRADFIPGQDTVPASGKVLGTQEFVNLVDASLEGWLTTGRYNQAFESRLAAYLGVRHALTCNSGSSANLLAISALTSPLLGARALKPGDEVITAAAGFPTTANPIVQNGLVPVFVDSDIPSYNPSPSAVEKAVTPSTRAIILAHTLGNPLQMSELRGIADRHQLWLIEDCCDALGSTHDGRHVGTWGDIGTLSFYPAHHITMGEGGAVFTSNPLLKRVLESMRDWGRDCWCNPGFDNTCGKRFDRQFGQLPPGYDHKYVYSHAGYNLKITDLQAAVGLAQLDRIDSFVKARQQNFAKLSELLAPLSQFFILPEATPNTSPSWFGFPITLREAAPFGRLELLRHLDKQKVGTRLLFAGNLTRQPYFLERAYRVAGTLDNADAIMQRTFWVGIWPELGDAQLKHIAQSLQDFCQTMEKNSKKAPA